MGEAQGRGREQQLIYQHAVPCPSSSRLVIFVVSASQDISTSSESFVNSSGLLLSSFAAASCSSRIMRLLLDQREVPFGVRAGHRDTAKRR